MEFYSILRTRLKINNRPIFVVKTLSTIFYCHVHFLWLPPLVWNQNLQYASRFQWFLFQFCENIRLTDENIKYFCILLWIHSGSVISQPLNEHAHIETICCVCIKSAFIKGKKSTIQIKSIRLIQKLYATGLIMGDLWAQVIITAIRKTSF